MIYIDDSKLKATKCRNFDKIINCFAFIVSDISSMESQPLIKFHHYHYVAVLLMLLAGIRFEVSEVLLSCTNS